MEAARSTSRRRDRRVKPALERRDPQRYAEQRVPRVAPLLRAIECYEPHDARGGDRQPDRIERIRIDHADDRYRGDVVEDGQCQQEHPQLGRAARADDGKRSEQERGVRADHDSPAPGFFARRIERQIEQGGDDHAPQRRGGGDEYAPTVGQLAHRKFATDFEPDDEEEQRHQSVVHPVAKIHR
jgi:hypothetical protein